MNLDIYDNEIFLIYDDGFTWKAGIIELSRQITEYKPKWIKVNINSWENENKGLKKVLSISKRTGYKLHMDNERKTGI